MYPACHQAILPLYLPPVLIVATARGKTLPSITQERIGEFVKTAFQVLAENEGHLPSRDVARLAAPRLHLNEHELELLPSSVPRWENALQWYTVDSVKAEWLIKRNGVWYLTDEG